MNLEENTYCENAIIYGNVINSNKIPIENAKVSFFDEHNKKLGYVYTSKEGFYIYFGCKLNTKIYIIVQKSEYRKYISNLLKLCSQKIKFNIVFKKIPKLNYSLVSGHVIDINNNPLKDINIYLLKNISNNKFKLYKATILNSYGQFIFDNIPKGNYTLFINDPKFYIHSKYIEIDKSSKIFDVNIVLNKKNMVTKISGQIKNSNGEVIKNSLVVLYKIKANKNLEPFEYTTCNEEGKYEFTNLPHGDYIVKSKK